MRILLMMNALALTAACTFVGGGPQNASARGCHAVATQNWAAGDQALSIDATSAGPDCEHGVATIVIRDTEGEVLWVTAYPTAQVMTLQDARDAEAMEAAMREWIAPENNTMETTAALPPWPENAEAPTAGEFPFYVEEGLDRDAYESIRAANHPLYCYVQGMESLACLASVDGGLGMVGVQLFPG
ncbi:MAG: hypothetical protein H7124_08180 [Phycisphaerales bacterium]|nr:hypothetical protein [Hyphomonadaceae bacterium]